MIQIQNILNEIPSLPIIQLDSNAVLWLTHLWESLKINGKLPIYQELRAKTLAQTGPSFNPNKLDTRLVGNHATEITLLGAIYIDEDRQILSTLNEIFSYIKHQLIENPNRQEFILSDIASTLFLKEVYVRVIFNLVSDCFHVWDSAGSRREGGYGFDHFTISYPSTFEKYMDFISIEKTLNEYFLRISNSETESISYNTRDVNKNSIQFSANRSREKSISFKIVNSECYIDDSRIDELENITSNLFDLSKLIQLCIEANVNYYLGNYYSVGILVRAIIDHVPPIFKYGTFNELANNYTAVGNERSFKKAMVHLNISLRNVGDSYLHSLIRKSETIPTKVQVDFRSDLDILLGEIIRVLRYENSKN